MQVNKLPWFTRMSNNQNDCSGIGLNHVSGAQVKQETESAFEMTGQNNEAEVVEDRSPTRWGNMNDLDHVDYISSGTNSHNLMQEQRSAEQHTPCPFLQQFVTKRVRDIKWTVPVFSFVAALLTLLKGFTVAYSSSAVPDLMGEAEALPVSYHLSSTLAYLFTVNSSTLIMIAVVIIFGVINCWLLGHMPGTIINCDREAQALQALSIIYLDFGMVCSIAFTRI